jgi:hypothetical protein
MKRKLMPKKFSLWILVVLAALLLRMIACRPGDRLGLNYSAGAFPEAEKIFHEHPGWLGADAALTIPLGRERTLWLFGDTFIASSEAHVRSESKMVRNTIAVQEGNDPCSASIMFYWGREADGSQASYFPNREKEWYWPGHGLRLEEGPLVVFLSRIERTSDDVMGFACTGYALAVINNPDDSPEDWRPVIVDAPAGKFDAVPATAVLRDGDYVVALAIKQEGMHAGAFVRWRAEALAGGELGAAEWWAGTKQGWVPETELGPEGPDFVLEDAGAECSLHWDRRTRSFLHIASYGFGASTIGMRTAPTYLGPWTPSLFIYRPPESDAPRPLVYAAKAHPELLGPSENDLLITYATNSFAFGDLFTPEGQRFLYRPRFVILRLNP